MISEPCVSFFYRFANNFIFDSTVHYCDQQNKLCQFRSVAVPTNLQAKFMLLTYFANYMDKHLLKVYISIHFVMFV